MDIQLLEDITHETTAGVRMRIPTEKDGFSPRDMLWSVNPEIRAILKRSDDIEIARRELFDVFSKREWHLQNSRHLLHPLLETLALESIGILKTIISTESERKSGYSSLAVLRKIAQSSSDSVPTVSTGFIEEFVHLFKGAWGKADIYPRDPDGNIRSPAYLEQHGREAARTRTRLMDSVARRVASYIGRYPSGLESDSVERRNANRGRIMRYFDVTIEEWYDYRWHMKNVIRDLETLSSLIELREQTMEAIRLATTYHVPFGITPYYLSLMDPEPEQADDHAIRAQVLPPLDYVQCMVERREDRSFAFDFMGEHDTSPVDIVTRRYPGIAIIKPFNTCAQICVYCQRNWEIDDVLAPNAMANKTVLHDAIDWIRNHSAIGEVLITGGDPCLMTDTSLDKILAEFASMPHVYRIRIGTRTPVVLPMRWTDHLVDILEKYQDPGRREIAVVTHAEHPYEITPDLTNAVQKIRNAGIGVYNQEVFTTDNSRRFETAKLRKELRIVGIDPYYTFNMKGKAEMKRYRVPIARLLQERKEEARLFPGLDRTDEPVFNVPRLGKTHLRAGQDRRLIMIRPDGARIYEIDPWEKNIAAVTPYIYTDVPILEYLSALEKRGEDPADYRTIWYYH